MFWSCFSKKEYAEDEWTAVLSAEAMCVAAVHALWWTLEGLPLDRKIEKLVRFVKNLSSFDSMGISSAELEPSWLAGFLNDQIETLKETLARLPEDYGRDGSVDGAFFALDFERVGRCRASSPRFSVVGSPAPERGHTGFKKLRRTRKTREKTEDRGGFQGLG